MAGIRLYGRAHLAAMLIHRIQTISIIHIPPTAKQQYQHQRQQWIKADAETRISVVF